MLIRRLTEKHPNEYAQNGILLRQLTDANDRYQRRKRIACAFSAWMKIGFSQRARKSFWLSQFLLTSTAPRAKSAWQLIISHSVAIIWTFKTAAPI
jgi:hypothetical protein